MKTAISAIIFFIIHASFAQRVDSLSSPAVVVVHRLALYPELLGNGGMFSGDLEYIIVLNSRRGGYARVRKGALPFGGNSTLIESGYLAAMERSFFDIGLGYTSFDTNPERSAEYFYSLRLGYRYQGRKGFIFKIAPHLGQKHESDENQYFFHFGITLGQSFRLATETR